MPIDGDWIVVEGRKDEGETEVEKESVESPE